MAVPLLTTDYWTKPEPQGSISNAAVRLMAMAGQAISERVQKNAELTEARLIAPTMSNILTQGMAQIAAGDMGGFGAIAQASTMGAGNPLIASMTKDASSIASQLANRTTEQAMLKQKMEFETQQDKLKIDAERNLLGDRDFMAADKAWEKSKAIYDEQKKIDPANAVDPGPRPTREGFVSSAPVSSTRIPETDESGLPIGFITKMEGFKPKAYNDGAQTSIGYGTRAKSADEVLDEPSAMNRLKEELSMHAKRIDEAAAAKGINLNQNQRSALISFDYNTGKGVKAINSDDIKSAILNGPKTQQGKYLKGLEERRKKEAELFSKPMEVRKAETVFPDPSDPSKPAKERVRPMSETADEISFGGAKFYVGKAGPEVSVRLSDPSRGKSFTYKSDGSAIKARDEFLRALGTMDKKRAVAEALIKYYPDTQGQGLDFDKRSDGKGYNLYGVNKEGTPIQITKGTTTTEVDGEIVESPAPIVVDEKIVEAYDVFFKTRDIVKNKFGLAAAGPANEDPKKALVNETHPKSRAFFTELVKSAPTLKISRDEIKEMSSKFDDGVKEIEKKLKMGERGEKGGIDQPEADRQLNALRTKMLSGVQEKKGLEAEYKKWGINEDAVESDDNYKKESIKKQISALDSEIEQAEDRIRRGVYKADASFLGEGGAAHRIASKVGLSKTKPNKENEYPMDETSKKYHVTLLYRMKEKRRQLEAALK